MFNSAYIATHIATGNLKLPKSTYIFNSGAAMDCPSRKLGLCQCEAICYAMRAENMYVEVLPYRRRQHQILNTVTANEFVCALIQKSKRACINKCKSFRYNEAGDFETQANVEWFADVCRQLAAHGIVCYGYTARTDLDLTNLILYSSVQVSNDNGNWTSRGANRFVVVDEYTPGKLHCAGNCRICTLCQNISGQRIEICKH